MKRYLYDNNLNPFQLDPEIIEYVELSKNMEDLDNEVWEWLHEIRDSFEL
jgi:hypothetical protein